MSSWYDVNSEDINLDYDEREVNVWVHSGDHGSVYAVLTFDQVEEMYKKIKNPSEEGLG